jgi:hypothetical protein
LHLHKIDVHTAFLHSVLQEDIYMKPLPFMRLAPDQVLKLKKSIYGLKQAGREWNDLIHSKLLSFGFSLLSTDNGMYIYKNGADFMLLGLFVDDMLIASTTVDIYMSLNKFLSDSFEIVACSSPELFLGMKITYGTDSIALSQPAYISHMLSKFQDCLSSTKYTTPMSSSLRLGRHVGVCHPRYREAIGSLLFLAVSTRPDIAYATNYLARFVHNAGDTHFRAAMRVMQYVRDTDYSLRYTSSSSLRMYGATDSDWAADIVSHKSTMGSVLFFAGAPVMWTSTTIKTVSLSANEAELNALTETCKDAVWLYKTLAALELFDVPCIAIAGDNAGSIQLARLGKHTRKTRHLLCKFAVVRQWVSLNIIKLVKIASNVNVADIFTKALAQEPFSRFTSVLF